MKIKMILAAGVLLFCGCASEPGFKGKGDLCGLVIDENNRPVRDFVVYNSCGARPSLTNETGIFVFYDLPSGDYYLSGEKKNFLKIEETFYRFNDRSKIIVLQTRSFNSVILNAEELLQLNQFDEAADLLKNVCCEANSPEEEFFEKYVAKIQEVKNEKVN